MISYDDYRKKRTSEQRAKVDELARQLIAEEKSRRDLALDEENPQASATV